MEKLKTYLEKYNEAKILDIGTEKGSFISLIDYIYQDYSEIVGIDIVDYISEMNSEAIKKNPRVKYFEEDILNTNFNPGSFDIVCLSNSIHHFADIPNTIANIVDMVKESGILIISEQISDNLDAKQMSHKLLHHFEAKIDRYLGRIHQQTFSEARLLELLENETILKIKDYWRLDNKKSKQEDLDINRYLERIDSLLEVVKDSKDYEDYLMEATELKAYLQKNGFALAEKLIVIATK
jgi:ubiquinone/menaquinone biosynthesis C-methylase UbiE